MSFRHYPPEESVSSPECWCLALEWGGGGGAGRCLENSVIVYLLSLVLYTVTDATYMRPTSPPTSNISSCTLDMDATRSYKPTTVSYFDSKKVREFSYISSDSFLRLQVTSSPLSRSP